MTRYIVKLPMGYGNNDPTFVLDTIEELQEKTTFFLEQGYTIEISAESVD